MTIKASGGRNERFESPNTWSDIRKRAPKNQGHPRNPENSGEQGPRKGEQRSIRRIMAVTVNLGIKFANVILDAKKKEKVIRSIFLR